MARAAMSANAPAPDRFAVDILVEDARWDNVPDALVLAERAAQAALAACGDAFARAAEMSVTLTDDARIRVLNRQWREKDKATNVLSFPAAEVPEDVTPEPLGDVIVALETVLAEAQAEDKRPQDHLVHLVVHGTLHLLGFDHEDDAEAEEMEEMERGILEGLGISDPYALPAET